MIRLLIVASLVATGIALQPHGCFAADPLTVVSDFEGASVRALDTDRGSPQHQFHARRGSGAGLAMLVVLSHRRDHARRDDHVAIAGLDGNA